MATTFRLGLSLVCLLLSCSCNALTSEEIFLQQYEAAFNASGIPYNETLVFDTSAYEPQGADFTCPDLPKEFINKPATSVHSLAPYHIKVVGAVGDSVTAGFGAKACNIFQFATEYRGVSWSVGGDGDVAQWVTLPNIIKKFNPGVKGFSIGKGKTNKKKKLNRAVSGAVSADIPGQVADLISRIKADSNINVAEDWKLVTIWIGGNDLCRFCKNRNDKSPANYVKHIKQALDMLKAELPRTYVNLVQILDVTKLGALKGSLLCGLVQLFACDCGTNSKYEDETSQASRDYNDALETMIEDGGYDSSDEFTVVLQPFFKNVELPKENGKPDATYFGLDCFHFSVKGHRKAAESLWNNMMEPVGSKAEHIDWKADPVFKCPTEAFPYFYTRKNSLSVAGFGGVNPDPSSAADNSGTPNLLAILLGTGVAVYIAAMTVIIAIVAVVYTRRRRQRSTTSPGVSVRMSVDTEKTRLIFKD